MADTYGNIDAVFQQTYSSNVALAVQQLDSRFSDCFTYMPDVKGKQMQAVSLVGKSEARVNGAEDSETPDIRPKHEGIHVKPSRLDWGRLMRKGEDLKAAVDFQSAYVQEGAGAMMRGRDALLAAGFFGARLIANTDDGAVSSVAWAGSSIASDYKTSGTHSGMKFEKIIGALRAMGRNDLRVDQQDVYCAVTWLQMEDLLNDAKITGREYSSRMVLDNVGGQKMVREFFGVKFVTFESLTVNGSSRRRCPMWAKSGMHWGPAIPLSTNIAQRADRQFQTQLYIEEWLAVTRSEDEKVVEILCAES